MNTCERCGADAVDARGVCQNCGWQRRGNGFTDTVGAPSLGETRAADVMPLAASQGAYPPSGNQPLRGPNSGGGAVQYCGACGARIEPGHAFCGQCGTPVRSVSGGGYGASQAGAPSPSNPSRFRVGDTPGWRPDDGNAPTEEIRDLPPQGAYGRSGSGVPYQAPPYSRSGYGGTSVDQPVALDSSRTLRMILGVLCLVGSLISAVAAIVLALITIH